MMGVEKKNLYKLFLAKNKHNNIQLKKIRKIEDIKNDIKKKLIDNIIELKQSRNIKNLELINNWDLSLKKETLIKQKITKKLLKIKINNLVGLKIIENLKNNYSQIMLLPIIKKFNLDDILKKFIYLNTKKLRISMIKNYYKNNKFIYYLIDIRKLKTKIIIFGRNKCYLTLTNGLLFKKMMLNNKKYKKSEKVTFLTIKNSINLIKNLNNCNKYFIQIKGLNNKWLDYVKFIKNNFSKFQKKGNFMFLNSYKISNNYNFKFKKIKAIKRRLKKKFIKLK